MSIRVHVIKKIVYGDTLGSLPLDGNLDELVKYDRLNCDACGSFDILKDDVLELLNSEEIKLTLAEKKFCNDLIKRMGGEDYIAVSCW